VSQSSENRRETAASGHSAQADTVRVAPRVEKFPAVNPKFKKDAPSGEGSGGQDGGATAQGEG
jgi:hypothetical protein